MYTGNVVNSEIKIHATVVSRNVFFPRDLASSGLYFLSFCRLADIYFCSLNAPATACKENHW